MDVRFKSLVNFSGDGNNNIAKNRKKPKQRQITPVLQGPHMHHIRKKYQK